MDPDGTPRVCDDPKEWSAFFGDPKRRQIAVDELPGLKVSTVFLGIDHGFGPNDSEPQLILFETMWFADANYNLDIDLLEVQERYCTIDEARTGHARWLLRAQVLTGEHGAKLREACLSCWHQCRTWGAVDKLIDASVR